MTTTCIYCKAKIPKGAKFCPSCGEKPYAEEEAKPKYLDPVLTVEGAAKLLKITKPTFYTVMAKHMQADPIPYFIIGAHKRFLTEDLLAWARRQQVVSQPNTGAACSISS